MPLPPHKELRTPPPPPLLTSISLLSRRSFWNSVAPSRSRRTERGAEGMKERGGVLLTPPLPPHCVHGMSASGSALRVSF